MTNFCFIVYYTQYMYRQRGGHQREEGGAEEEKQNFQRGVRVVQHDILLGWNEGGCVPGTVCAVKLPGMARGML